jgi:hypothetical protein
MGAIVVVFMDKVFKLILLLQKCFGWWFSNRLLDRYVHAFMRPILLGIACFNPLNPIT